MSLRHPTLEANEKSQSVDDEKVANAVLFEYQKFYLEYIHELMISDSKSNRAAGVILSEMIMGKQNDPHFWFLVRKNILEENEDLGEKLKEMPRKDRVAKMLRALKRATDQFVLEKAPKKDYLTGGANRMAFDEDLTECEKSPRDEKVMVAFIDIDQLKTVNDTLGHDMGDAMIKLVMSRLNSSIKRRNIAGAGAYRFGGDELAVLITNRNPDEKAYLQLLAEILDDVVRDKVRFDGKTWQQTLSVGVAFVRDFDLKGAQQKVLKAADDHMYLAKATRGEEVRNKPKEGISAKLKETLERTKTMYRDQSKWAIAYGSYPAETLDDVSENSFVFSKQGELTDDSNGNLTFPVDTHSRSGKIPVSMSQ
ncbi:MAG TPA: diguanylate cyclase [Candidatus Saccharimonadia bacterium]|nr:diguanylate cyclase [Candidatus Saccharimonadia bacterium]